MQVSPENFLNRIRALIAEGETSMAIQELQQFLASDSKFQALQSWVLNISAQFNRSEKEGRKGLITNDSLNVQRNKINDQLLQITSQIKSGNFDLPAGTRISLEAPNKNKWIIPLLGIIILASLAFGAWRIFGQSNPTATCPGFQEGSEFNLLLFPFREVGGGEDLNPEISIMDRLDALCSENGIRSSIRIHPGLKQSLDFPTATNEGDKCEASMVIWGTVEQHAGLTDLTTRYKYLGNSEGLEVTQLQLYGESQVDTSTSISSIVRQGVLTKNIEELIMTIFGLIAHQEEKFDVAANALESAARTDTSGAILTGVLLADAYLAMGKAEKAIEAYDQVLNVHPEYKLALNNRATLLFSKGNFQGAVTDFSQVIKMEPENADALAGRIAANTKLQDQQAVQRDQRVLKRIQPKRLQLISNIFLTLDKPVHFTNYDSYLNVREGGGFKFPFKSTEKKTLVFSGIIPNGKSKETHVIEFYAANAQYQYQIKVKDDIKVQKTLTNARRYSVTIDANTNNKKIQTPEGIYYFIVERNGNSGPLNYEVSITINP